MQRDVVMISSADDKFAVGLAGTFKSLLQYFDPQRRLKLYVLDGGITDANKDALLRHWNDPRLSVEWVRVNRDKVSSFVVTDHVTDAVLRSAKNRQWEKVGALQLSTT